MTERWALGEPGHTFACGVFFFFVFLTLRSGWNNSFLMVRASMREAGY